MGQPTCNPWIANTIRQSDQLSARRQNSAKASTYELPDETFLAAVIDALQRLAVKGVTGFQNITTYNNCDGERTAHDANVQFMQVSLPIQTATTQQKQQILWQLASALCANAA